MLKATNRLATKLFVVLGLMLLGLAGCRSVSDSSSGPGTTNTTVTFSLGSISGSTFTNGVILVGIGSSTLSAGGTTTLQVNIVDSDGNLATNSVDVNFSSPCIGQGTATITTPVTTSTGTAVTSYTAAGCTGSDLITARAVVSGATLTATATLNVAADTVQSIAFNSVDQSLIQLAGTGGDETATVTFQVFGASGSPVSGVNVTFSLPTAVGGLSLTPTTATSDSNGFVSTVVQAGTVATTVRVTATITTPNLSAQSNQLTVSTGLPDQNSMSLSTSVLNPDAWLTDGTEVTITARMSDAFNNPPPVGTAITFTTEGGSIGSQCTTDATGACSVSWFSQNPRPTNGRVTILATAIGNESFSDTNGSGLFEVTDQFSIAGCTGSNVPALNCDDVAEAYLDSNENGVRDSSEPFIDFDQDGNYDAADGIYNGVLCSASALASADCNRNSVTVREDLVIAMSSRNSVLLFNETSGTVNDGTLDVTGGAQSLSITVQDENGQAMPFGTTVVSTIDGNASACFQTVGPQINFTFPSTLSTFGRTVTFSRSTATAATCVAAMTTVAASFIVSVTDNQNVETDYIFTLTYTNP